MREDLIAELRELCAIEGRPLTVGERARTKIAMSEAAAALEAAREDAGMRRFADMLLGGLNDIQDALGFTDEDKLCANGSAEILAEIAELREDAERYRWLRQKVSAHGVIDGWTFAFPTHLTLPAPASAMRDPAGGLDAAIDQARGKAP